MKKVVVGRVNLLFVYTVMLANPSKFSFNYSDNGRSIIFGHIPYTSRRSSSGL